MHTVPDVNTVITQTKGVLTPHSSCYDVSRQVLFVSLTSTLCCAVLCHVVLCCVLSGWRHGGDD